MSRIQPAKSLAPRRGLSRIDAGFMWAFRQASSIKWLPMVGCPVPGVLMAARCGMYVNWTCASMICRVMLMHRPVAARGMTDDEDKTALRA
jgi:hypothetical protein